MKFAKAILLLAQVNIKIYGGFMGMNTLWDQLWGSIWPEMPEPRDRMRLRGVI